MNKVKPCPFCGEPGVLLKRISFNDSYDNNVEYDIGCLTKGCFLENGGDYWLPEEKIIKLWNNRRETYNAI